MFISQGNSRGKAWSTWSVLRPLNRASWPEKGVLYEEDLNNVNEMQRPFKSGPYSSKSLCLNMFIQGVLFSEIE